ncbi:MAG TPA: ATP-dependent DNA helicase [Candidatus Woesebacteria bacterium]|nr:ATP-dependent DNA helicase [Candidatus Woesebacteria bacterium]
MKKMTNFELAYQSLNPLQKAAVDHIEQGPLLLIAGPGTGKTQVLSLRIANILRQTDAKPDTILALTFTEAAAKNMRERLLKIIGKDAYYVNISTFHAFCRQVIAEHGEYFPLQRESEHLSELDRYQLFENLLDELKPEHLRPLNDQYFYVNDIIQAISDLKREGISVLQFDEMVRAQEQELLTLKEQSKSKTKIAALEKKFLKNKNLLLLYQAYQERLRQTLRFDYDDMINFVVEAFSTHELLLREYQENLHYFLVDEYQDTNSAQNKLVNLLVSYWEEMGGMADLFAVGDPNQAIYRFQGASVENVLAFTRTYPNATVITLDTAYRCPQNIYDLATHIIAHNKLSQLSSLDEKIQLVTHLKNPKGVSTKIKFFQAPSQVLEAVSVVEEIKKLQETGVALTQIAVLYRNHADANDLIEAAKKWAIAYRLSKGDDVLQNENIAQLLDLMRLISNLREAQEIDLLYNVMTFSWLGLDPLVVMKLGRVAGTLRLDLYDLIARGLDFINQALVGQEITPVEFATITAFLDKLRAFGIKDQMMTFNHFFEEVLSDKGFAFLAYLKTLPDSFEQIAILNALFAEVKSMLNNNHQLKLNDFLKQIATYQEHKIEIQSKTAVTDNDAVYFSTVHSAKGMEWDYVFLINLVDKKWGNQKDNSKIKLPTGIIKNTDLSDKERNEDDRRLFYVALTRAKKQLYLSFPLKIVENNQISDKFPSIFLQELKEIEDKTGTTFLEVNQNSQIIEQAPTYLSKLMSPAPVRSFGAEEQAFLETLVKDFQLSVTALNTYLRDPKEFLEKNLLRIPRAKKTFMSFGTAVHAALERFYKLEKQTLEVPNLEFLLAEFTHALEKEVLSTSDFTDRLQYGRQILTSYYQDRLLTKVNVFDVERSFGSGRKIFLGDIPLSGKIDRIDLVDQERGLLRVYDYKTGEPKTRGGIEATSKTYQKDFSKRELELPATIRGPYKRQLIFYKLLLDLDRTINPNWQVSEAVFEFIEPKTKGGNQHVAHAYVITDEEIADLKQLIKQVMQEIRSLSFLHEVPVK